jgi:hypothetical protein
MTSKVYVVELVIVEKRYRTVAVRAESPAAAWDLALAFDNLEEDEAVELSTLIDADDETVEVLADPREPTVEEMRRYAAELAELD